MLKKSKFKFISLLILLIPTIGFAQDDLMSMLDSSTVPTPHEVLATFKSDRIINGQSIERMHEGQLDFRINHRFGQLNSGAYNLFGLDNALINFCLEYGIKNWWQVGVRRGTDNKTYDGSFKFSLLRQTTGGAGSMPVSISFFTDASIKTIKDPTYVTTADRMAFTYQLLIARKFNENLSLQLSPSFVHRNIVANADTVNHFVAEKNDVLACGLGGRYKLTRRLSLTFEYFYSSAVGKNTATKYYYPISLGVDLETGGHVFQLFITNSQKMVEDGFITQTQGDISKGGIYFGFNISRVFGGGKKVKE